MPVELGLVTWESKRVSPSSLKSSRTFYSFLMPGKRKNRSKGSKDSLPSPDEKKSKDEAAKAHSTASETDEVFQALEIAEGLGKLDTNEKSLILLKAA